MPWRSNQPRRFHQSPRFIIGAALLLVLLVAAAFLAPRAKVRYTEWSANRHSRRAAEYQAKGDHEHALRSARRALEINDRNLQAIRVIAQTLEAMDSREAVEWREKFGEVRPGDAENTLAWAQDVIRQGDTTTAGELIGELKPEHRNGAAYHDVAARVALAKRDLAAAEAHWIEAAQLDPGNDAYRLNLATLRLNSPVSGTRAAALDVLRELSTRPASRLPTLRTMLGDANKRGDAARARDIAASLASAPDATLDDKLTHLGTLRAQKDPAAAALLLELKAANASNPSGVFKLMDWLGRNGMATQALDWAGSLPAEIASKPPVCVAVAEARASDLQWEKLRETLGLTSRDEVDFLRRAFLSRALGRLDDEKGATAAWESSVADAGKSPEGLERLAVTVLDWGWQDRAEQALWKLAGNRKCPRWALDVLWDRSFARGDSLRLYKVSAILANTGPKSIVHRNNAVFLGLLIRDTASATHDKNAETLYKEEPGNPAVVSTLALSLYQRGRVPEAIGLLDLLRPEHLRRPNVALYHGLLLTAAGQSGKAARSLAIAARGPMLREEKALLAKATLTASGEAPAATQRLDAAAAAGPDELAALITSMNDRQQAALVSEWATRLDRAIGAKPAVRIAIAESHARALEWRRLLAFAGAESWAGLDYIRNACRARALDRLDDPAGAAAAWKAAMADADKIPGALEKLAALVHRCGWEPKAGEVLWKLSSASQLPAWAIPVLWEISLNRGDSAQLHKAAALMLKADPAAVRPRNASIALALLTHRNENAVRALVGTLCKESPDDAALASIRAVSLCGQDRAIEAMASLDAFTPGDLEKPGTALFHAAFLSQLGRSDVVRRQLEIIAAGPLTPEEQSLLAHIKAAQGSDSSPSNP